MTHPKLIIGQQLRNQGDTYTPAIEYGATMTVTYQHPTLRYYVVADNHSSRHGRIY